MVGLERAGRGERARRPAAATCWCGPACPPAALRVTADPALLLPPAAADALARAADPRGADAGRAAPHVAICLRNLPRNPPAGPGYLLPVSVRDAAGPGGSPRAAGRPQRAERLLFRPAGRGRRLPDHALRGAGDLCPLLAGARRGAGRAGGGRACDHPERAHILRAANCPAPVLRALLGEMDAVLALRLHALIFAAAAGCRCWASAMRARCRGFLAAVGQAERDLDPPRSTGCG